MEDFLNTLSINLDEHSRALDAIQTLAPFNIKPEKYRVLFDLFTSLPYYLRVNTTEISTTTEHLAQKLKQPLEAIESALSDLIWLGFIRSENRVIPGVENQEVVYHFNPSIAWRGCPDIRSEQRLKSFYPSKYKKLLKMHDDNS